MLRGSPCVICHFGGCARLQRLFCWPAARLYRSQRRRHFQVSVKALDTAGGQLLSDLAVAERRIGKTRAIARSQSSIIRSKSGAVLTRLNPSDAPYFATIGDPPAVNIFRHAFKTIVVYADTLIALSDGSDAAAVQGQISEFAKVVDTLGTALAFLPAPIPGVAALIPYRE